MMEFLNSYYFLRHGQSAANTEGIIVSSPETGCTGYGLTEKGILQVKDSLDFFACTHKITKILTSDFLRAKETAEIAKNIFNIEFTETPLLRERNFGKYDGTSDSNYKLVWTLDKENEENTINDVESPRSVSNRILMTVSQCETEYRKEHILMVSHGDAIQIGYVSMKGLSPALHRTIKPFTNAELRKV